MGLMEMALPRLRALLDEVYAVAGSISFPRNDQQQLTAGLFFARVHKLSEGVFDAVKREDETSGFILLRSLLEAYVDLRNVAADPNYVNHVIASNLKEQIKSARGRRDDVVNEKAAELEELTKNGFPPLNIWKRFERVDECETYRGIYWYLCLHSHNSLHVLEKTHLDISQLRINVFAKLSDVDAQLLVDTVAGIVANAVAEVKRLQEDGEPTGLEGVGDALNELRELWKLRPDEENGQGQEQLSSSMD